MRFAPGFHLKYYFVMAVAVLFIHIRLSTLALVRLLCYLDILRAHTISVEKEKSIFDVAVCMYVGNQFGAMHFCPRNTHLNSTKI